jgi:flagellar biosynthesis protein FlhF
MKNVKTFRAASLQEALSIVRREMGEEARILDTRQVSKKRFIPWLKAKELVEVTASLSIEQSEDARPESKAPFQSLSDGESGVDLSFCADDSADADATPMNKAADIAAELGRRHADKNRLEENLRSLEDSYHDLLPGGRLETCPTTKSTEPLPQSTNSDAPKQVLEDASTAAKLIGQAQVNAPDASDILSNKLDSLRKMVQSLTHSHQFGGTEEIPTELFEIYTQLIDADVDDDLARELIFRLKESCEADQLSDPIVTRGLLSGMVESELNCTNPICIEPGRRKVVALVGPTGVGKTTTIAKLAANFRLRDGVKMGLVTVDTYRIAAVEQLRTYAEIIDLPMKVVTSPQEMRRALDDLAGLDLILIDTAGRSPRDELKIQELKSLLSEADVDEVHLVMSLTASVRSIAMTCEQFQGINPTALVLTKLDEAAGMGCLLSVARQVPLPVSYLTTGQDVPEDIEPAKPSRISRLVLGEDRLFD